MSETKEPHVAGAPPEDTPAEVPTVPVTEADAPVQTEPEVKRKRGRPRKTPAPENESGADAKTPNKPPAPEPVSSDQRILSIDGRRTVATEADKAKNDLLDLMESLRSKRILTGKIQGVEGNPDSEPRAVVYRGEFKILIPASMCIERPTDFRDMKPNEVLKYQITKRLGAEIEYIVKGVDPESGVVVASRMEAMEIRRRQFYFGKDRDGNSKFDVPESHALRGFSRYREELNFASESSIMMQSYFLLKNDNQENELHGKEETKAE